MAEEGFLTARARRRLVARFPQLAHQMRCSTGFVHRRDGRFRLPPGFGRSLGLLPPHAAQMARSREARRRLCADLVSPSVSAWNCLACGFANLKSYGTLCGRCDWDASEVFAPVVTLPRPEARR